MRRLLKLNLRKIHLLDKQQRFIIQTFTLTTGLLITQLIWDDYRFIMVIILSFLSYILTAWSLKEDIKGIEWFMLFILPVTFTASVSLFYFLLPGRWISRLILTSIFTIGTYAIVRAENIFNVAIERSIQLLRVAQTVGLLLTLVVTFFTTIIVFSFRAPFFLNLIFFSLVTFILTMQSLWSVKLDGKITKQLILYSAVVGGGIGEVVLALSFLPVFRPSILALSALFVSSCFYGLVGVIQQYFLGRLFSNTIREYIVTFLFMLIFIILATSWG